MIIVLTLGHMADRLHPSGSGDVETIVMIVEIIETKYTGEKAVYILRVNKALI